MNFAPLVRCRGNRHYPTLVEPGRLCRHCRHWTTSSIRGTRKFLSDHAASPAHLRAKETASETVSAPREGGRRV